MRTNVYKQKIVSVLNKRHLLTIQEIYKIIPEIDYSTVVRNIEQLVKESKVRKIVLDKSRVMYEVNESEENHDHFVCVKCDVVEKLDRNVIDQKYLKHNTIADVLIRGLCQSCN